MVADAPACAVPLLPSCQIVAYAVRLTVPSTESGVNVADGLVVLVLKAVFGAVKEILENVQLVLGSPRIIDLGDLSS